MWMFIYSVRRLFEIFETTKAGWKFYKIVNSYSISKLSNGFQHCLEVDCKVIKLCKVVKKAHYQNSLF